MILPRLSFLIPFLLTAALPLQASAEIWTLNAGPGTQRLIDRDDEQDSTFFNVLAAVSCRSDRWNFALDFQGRWDIDEKGFDSDVWDRRGDFLRPLTDLLYTAPDGSFRIGFGRMYGWTPGGGYLVRGLSGYGEIDYVLPGFLIQWEKGDLKVELGMDRPVDPTVQAAAVVWEPSGKARFLVEGAVDPEAPESFSGDSSGGRPEADSARRLSGAAAGVLIPVLDGDVVDINAGVHGARLGDEGAGLGWELKASFDLSSYYRNRVSLGFGLVQCSGGYIPAWFDGNYSLRRWGLSEEPLLARYPIDDLQEERRMWMFDAGYELGRALKLSAGIDRFSDDSMTRGRFLLEISEMSGRGLEAGIWSQADSQDETLFTDEADLYSRISALYSFLPHLLLKVSYERAWAFREEDAAFVPLTSVILGVMYNLSL